MPARIRLFIPLAAFIGLFTLLLRGLSLDPQELPSALVDKPLPKFELLSLLDAEPVTERSLLGVPMLLNVWATWCISCRVEHPYLQQLSDQGIKIVGVNYKDEDRAAKKWLKDFGNPYRSNIVDKRGTLGLDLGVYGAPETYFVDADGIIRYRHVGVIDDRLWTNRLKAVYESLSKSATEA
ncbi:MAG: DsbE family thiol:disulfide interchange protein [Pseudomonadota bacterium]